MFTGIITDIGKIEAVEGTEAAKRFVIATRYAIEEVALGASIACSGVCLTVVDKGSFSEGEGGWFAVDVSPETLRCTTLSRWKEGSLCNLERAMAAGDEFGGHMVSGHVDGLTEIAAIIPQDGHHVMEIAIPKGYETYIVPKGSITLDGISLTVNAVTKEFFSINIIPHTWQHTTLHQRTPGDQLHVEVDMLARYIKRMLDVYLPEQEQGAA